MPPKGLLSDTVTYPEAKHKSNPLAPAPPQYSVKNWKNLPKQLGQDPQEEIAQHALVSSTVRFLGPKTQRVDIFGVPILDPRWEALRTA